MGRRILGAFAVVASVLVFRYCGAGSDGGRGQTASRAPEFPTPPAPRSAAVEARGGASVPADYVRDPLKFLSTAPVDSLVLLPGIGPVLAERLASARSGKRLFTRWEEILEVQGIGPKKLNRLKKLANE